VLSGSKLILSKSGQLKTKQAHNGFQAELSQFSRKTYVMGYARVLDPVTDVTQIHGKPPNRLRLYNKLPQVKY